MPKAKRPAYDLAMSNSDTNLINMVTDVAGTPRMSDQARRDGFSIANLNNPEMFATVPGTINKSIADTPISELEKVYKDHPVGLPVSGSDMGKMQNTRLVPGMSLPLPRALQSMPTPHIYDTVPHDRGTDPHRTLRAHVEDLMNPPTDNLENPNKGTD